MSVWAEEDPEFVIINKEPEPDPEDPSKLVYTEDPLILHTKTGRLINYVEDEEHGIRLFWHPPAAENGEEVDPSKVQFLPLGFDELEEQPIDEEKEDEDEDKKEKEKKRRPGKLAQKLLNWAEKSKKEAEMRKKLIEKELELVEAELCLEEAIEDMEEEAKTEGKEVIDETDVVVQQEEISVPFAAIEKKPSPEVEGKVDRDVEEDEVEEDDEAEADEDDDDDDVVPSSFGAASAGPDSTTNQRKGNGSSKSPFSTLSFVSSGLISTVSIHVPLSALQVLHISAQFAFYVDLGL